MRDLSDTDALMHFDNQEIRSSHMENMSVRGMHRIGMPLRNYCTQFFLEFGASKGSYIRLLAKEFTIRQLDKR